MTDKELLELAAKAAGIDPRVLSEENDGTWGYWNPLTDDGDALRLAVRLEMQAEYLEFTGNARARARGLHGETDWQTVYCMSADLSVKDPCAATRRAIVRAAATLGKELP